MKLLSWEHATPLVDIYIGLHSTGIEMCVRRPHEQILDAYGRVVCSWCGRARSMLYSISYSRTVDTRDKREVQSLVLMTRIAHTYGFLEYQRVIQARYREVYEIA